MKHEKQQIARIIRRDREQRGMTTKEHAEFLGVHFTTYHDWLNGRSIAPSAIAVLRLLQPEPAEIAA